MLNNLIDRIKLPFRKDKELFLSLHRITGIWPHHIEYYKIALLHSSIARRNEKGKPMNNERLEFLGDAVLDAVVGDIVFRHFPGKREGFLTTTRSKLVQRETLNHLAKEMGINKLILSSGHQSGHNSNMAGNAFEALVGAIYLDKGYDACMRFMERQILGEMINIDKLAYKEVNFKSKLIEWCQKNRVQLNFKLLGNETSEEGAPVFHFVVMLEDVEGCDARGYSKKESQQKASKDTLRKLRKDTKFLDRVFASKENRTKMEEEPVGLVPSVDETESFIVGDKPKEDRKLPSRRKSLGSSLHLPTAAGCARRSALWIARGPVWIPKLPKIRRMASVRLCPCIPQTLRGPHANLTAKTSSPWQRPRHSRVETIESAGSST